MVINLVGVEWVKGVLIGNMLEKLDMLFWRIL